VIATWRERSRPPAPAWAIVDLALAVALIVAGLLGFFWFSSTPWLLAAAGASLWWRGPGWRAIGLRRVHAGRTVALGAVAGLGYQVLSLYVIEPLIARGIGELPDVSGFASLTGDASQLAFWLVMSWTLAAFMEEMIFRGWLTARVAELWRFSSSGWIAAVIVSSVLFGAVHLYQGPSGVISTGLSGLVFGVVYLATGRNLWAPILAHGLADTVGFVMIYCGVYPGLEQTS
jgi:CAAX protease family protein